MLLNTRKRKTRVKFNPGLSANPPSNNWALDKILYQQCPIQIKPHGQHFHFYFVFLIILRHDIYIFFNALFQLYYEFGLING